MRREDLGGLVSGGLRFTYLSFAKFFLLLFFVNNGLKKFLSLASRRWMLEGIAKVCVFVTVLVKLERGVMSAVLGDVTGTCTRFGEVDQGHCACIARVDLTTQW